MVILLKGVNTFGILCTNCAEALILAYYADVNAVLYNMVDLMISNYYI
jgi:hypothetical protein